MLALALVSWALAAAPEPDLSSLAPHLAAVQARVHLPIVVGTADPTLVSHLNALDRAHDELAIVVVGIDPNRDEATQMKRALSRRAMRCGVLLEQSAGVWNVTEFGRCGASAPSSATVRVAPTTPG